MGENMRFSILMALTIACGGEKIIEPVIEDTAEDTIEVTDTDGDGIADSDDACPNDPDQWTDYDGDTVCDEIDDACPEDPNQWTDLDGDGHCDEREDDCPEDPTQYIDSDGDGICDNDDPCPNDPSNIDSDGDGICDGDDACPDNPDGGIDTDGDGICDESDDCPEDSNGYVDSNADGSCDEDDDNDGDGITNGEESIYGSDCAISNPTDPDTDDDLINDNEDPYPRDPWPEFILYQNDAGTIDLMLSNRDGTFQSPIEVGEAHGGTTNTNYRYIRFVIADFNDDGMMDFLAVGDSDPSDPSNDYDIWWFWREKADVLNQRLLGTWDKIPFYTLGDLNHDEKMDILGAEINKPNYISSVVLRFYSNQDKVHSANCFATTDTTNPDGCAFIATESVDLTNWTNGEWLYRQSRDAVDVDGDGNRDIAILRIGSGGNDSNVPVSILHGNGDGTFVPPTPNPLFSHNVNGCGNSPANSILFGDFNNDEIGDIITGLDDDGDAGSAWFYPGALQNGSYSVNLSSCAEAFDLNPNAESGGEHPGVSNSARNFDFDFDGNQDVIVGYRYQSPWSGPSKTVLLKGLGNGLFEPPIDIRDYPNSNYGSNFATPQRMCARFPF